MAAKKTVGRPPKYESKEQIEGLIEQYFMDCEGEILKDAEGNPILNKWGNPVIVNQRPPTITGLALALGFASRQALLNYQGKKEFNDTITRAKSRIEQYAEERLFDRDGSNGAKFSLSNNFSGWGEKPPSDLDEEEQRARIAQIKAQTDKLKGTDNGAELSRLDEVLSEIKGVV
nr:MAG TPA: DNA packaging protein gp3 [Caudoviricetes sp.]